jgi:hypothetical protein
MIQAEWRAAFSADPDQAIARIEAGLCPSCGSETTVVEGWARCVNTKPNPIGTVTSIDGRQCGPGVLYIAPCGEPIYPNGVEFQFRMPGDVVYREITAK